MVRAILTGTNQGDWGTAVEEQFPFNPRLKQNYQQDTLPPGVDACMRVMICLCDCDWELYLRVRMHSGVPVLNDHAIVAA